MFPADAGTAVGGGPFGEDPGMSFGNPLLLWIFPGLMLLVILDVVLRQARQRRLSQMIPRDLRDKMNPLRRPQLRKLRSLLFYLGLCLCAFSLSRPQWGFSWREAQREGLDLMVLVDTSNSMRADDFKPTRLQRAQWGIEELVGELKGDRVGLIAFAGEGVLQCPLTLDYGAFLMNVQDLFPGIVPTGGTNLSAALTKALESFEEGSEADKVLLLITDGETHQGNMDKVIADLKAKAVRVFAVGVGTPEGSLIPLDENANGFLKNRNQEVVKSNLNEAVLQKLATETDGLYVRAHPQDFGAGALIMEGLQPLKRAQLESERVKEMEERYQLFLGIGLICLLLEALAPLPALWFKRRVEA
jgi:Ca-activated chloride channel homolog